MIFLTKTMKKIVKGFNPIVKKGYGAWFLQTIPVSKSARDLMSKLLERDRAKRITAQEFMKHPWIKNEGVEGVESLDLKTNINESKVDDNDNDNDNDNNIKKISTFIQNCNFQMGLIHLFRNQFDKMRLYHFKELKKLFVKLDENNDEKLSFEEFEIGLTHMKDVELSQDEIKAMFEKHNCNLGVDDYLQHKEIFFEDFVNAAFHDYLVRCDERLFYAFKELDKDDDGIIKTDELKDVIRNADPCTKDRYNDILQVINDSGLDEDGRINV